MRNDLRMAKAEIKQSAGFKCPVCQQFTVEVIDSRADVEGVTIRRRRRCSSCAYRFSTYEAANHPHKAGEVANIRTAHLDALIAALKEAIQKYEHIRMHPDETPHGR